VALELEQQAQGETNGQVSLFKHPTASVLLDGYTAILLSHWTSRRRNFQGFLGVLECASHLKLYSLTVWHLPRECCSIPGPSQLRHSVHT